MGASPIKKSERGSGILQVARLACVSPGTVSNVLNRSRYVSPTLQRRVEAAVRKLRYHPDGPASALRTRRTRTLGLLISDVTNPFYTELSRAVEDRAAAAGFRLIVGNTDEDPQKQQEYLDVLLSLRVAGLIIAPAGGPPRGIERLHKSRIPIVFVNRSVPGLHVPVVTCDNTLGAHLATTHLLHHGHRRVGLLRPDLDISTVAERTEGYRRALAQRSVPYDPALICSGPATREGAAQLTENLLTRRAGPTALVIISNLMLEGALEAVRRLGLRCPRDVAVVTYNDQRLAEFVDPPLTCVAQPTREMGTIAVERILSLIEGRNSLPPLKPLAPRLIIRRSCGCRRTTSDTKEVQGQGLRSPIPNV